jgi:hypothetical protein
MIARRAQPLHQILRKGLTIAHGNDGAHEVLYSTSLPRSSSNDAGSTIQPSRQPVISHALENEFTAITRSSRLAISRKDGATPPSRP